MNKLNLVEILKDCPKGMELDCIICNGVKFIELERNPNFPIVVRANNGYEFTLTKYGQVHNIDDAKCVIFPKGKTTWEGFVLPYNFKDGDIVVSGFNLISIFKGIKGGYSGSLHSYVSVRKGDSAINIDKDCWTLENIRLATEEEKQKLLDAIKANGYKWNAETNTLEKLIEPKFHKGDRIRHKSYTREGYIVTEIKDTHYILDDESALPFIGQDDYELVPNKFDITTLQPFDKVLVRDECEEPWKCDFFVSMDWPNAENYPFMAVSGYFKMIVPYNEDTKHLIAKRDEAPEYYQI